MKSLTYRDAGVDIERGDAVADWIGRQARRTHGPQVVGGIGYFAGMYAMPAGLREPLLVSGTDGVGTKLKLAFATGLHGGVGIDLVAMSVNDVITVGAQPLFFLDYFATGQLEEAVARQVLDGVVRGCELGRCALLGGETAEMPGMYAPGEYDLAGFAVGVVERERAIDGRRIAVGDAVIGLPSSGLHSNGFSLVREVFAGEDLGATPPGLARPLGETLLTPTRIYTDAVARLIAAVDVKALVHVTGGGLVDNPPRALRSSALGFRLFPARWPLPPELALLQQRGHVALDEMRRTFNMGLGMLAVVPAADAERALEAAAADGALLVGEIGGGPAPVEFV